MGFRQHIIISGVLDAPARDRALRSALARWPFLRLPKREDGFADRLLLGLPELTDYLFESDLDYETAVEQVDQVEQGLPAWAAEFCGSLVAFLEADCFGGTCRYFGYSCRGRIRLEGGPPGPQGHLETLRQLGISTEGHFEPFTRGYFQGKCSGGPPPVG